MPSMIFTTQGGVNMAIYHCSVKIVSRSSGRSGVGASAYRSGQKLYNSYDGITHDYTRKGGIEYSEIMLPDHAPEEYKDRETLWNSVEKKEKNKNAQLSREVEIALPNELSREQQIELIHNYVNDNFVKEGMCVDFSIHSGHKHNKSKDFELLDQDINIDNPHAHIMLTMRPIDEHGEWGAKSRKVYILDEHGNKIYDKKKRQYKCYKENTTDWDKIETLEKWRENWEIECNNSLEKYGFEERIDHRSYKAQGIDIEPTVHLGKAHKMEQRGIESERGNLNREIKELNALKADFEQNKKEYRKLEQSIDERPIEQKERVAAETPREKIEVTKPRNESAKVVDYNVLKNMKAEVIANRLALLKKYPTDYEINIREYQKTRHNKVVKANEIAEKMENMLETANSIEQYKERIKELNQDKKELKIIDIRGKTRIKEDIKKLENVQLNAEKTLFTDFNISLKEVPEKLKELQNERKEIIKSIPNESDLEFWKSEKDKVADMYLAEKSIAEQRPDFAEIEKMEKALKQRFSPTMEHKMNNVSLENRFKNLSKKDIEKMKKIYPNKAEFNKIMDKKEKDIIEKSAQKLLKPRYFKER